MKIIEIKNLELPEVKVIKFQRFSDERGYFTETFRKSEIFFADKEFIQANESHSQKGTVRGLHLQFNPFMGKLIRTIQGHMVDLVLDARKNSKTFGKIIAYDMPQTYDKDFGEWIWVPIGFAHGNFYPSETTIEYLCTGDYNPAGEVCISPIANDIDWTLFDPGLKEQFNALVKNQPLFSEKDKNGLSIATWKTDPRSNNFI